MLKNYLEVGQIVSTHGIMGEVKINPWCDNQEMLCKFSKFYLDKKESEILEVVRSKPYKNVVLVKFKGIDSINETEKIIKKILFVNREDIKIEEGSYFIQDLINIDVLDIDTGIVYGKLKDITKTGANDVYHVDNFEKNKIYLIPAIKDVIIKTDIEDNKMYIRPLKGLLDL